MTVHFLCYVPNVLNLSAEPDLRILSDGRNLRLEERNKGSLPGESYWQEVPVSSRFHWRPDHSSSSTSQPSEWDAMCCLHRHFYPQNT